jgi:hypothetical protein
MKKVACPTQLKNSQLMDLTGKKFGRLLVTGYHGPHVMPSAVGHQWKCVCDCGNKVVVLGGGLRSGTRSCGCLQRELTSKAKLIDLTGQRFGKIIVLEFSHVQCKQPYWKCVCDCGNKKTICGANLRFGRTVSCGCYQKVARRTHGLSGKPGYKKLVRSDPVRKLRHDISCLVRHALRANGSSKKGKSVFEHLPYDVNDLKIHLESQFESWMSWDNWAQYNAQTWDDNDQTTWTWQIDHIKPCSTFKYTSMEDDLFQKCWVLENLRPYSAKQNIVDGANKVRHL